MRIFPLFILIILSPVYAETLVTENFIIAIENACEEGEVTCDKVQFTLSNVGFENKQSYVGKTLHTLCADKITPCAFQGYEFQTKNTRYIIYESGILEIINNNGTQMLLETGKWSY